MAIPSSAPRVSPDVHQVPTRARYVTIAFAMTLAIVTYIDRVCISQAAPLISHDLGPDQGPDGLGVLGVRLGLRAVRDSRRMAGRPAWAAPRADAHRDLVVVLHRGHRLGLERRVAARDARAVRHGRGGLLSEPHAHLHASGCRSASASARRRACGWPRGGEARSRPCSWPTCSTT